MEPGIPRLTHILAEGYKALDPVDLDLPEKLLFLIGSNGAGKSSTLQALAFVHFFASGLPNDFFYERGWEPASVRSRTPTKQHNTLRFHLTFEWENGDVVLWQFAWGLNSLATINEKMWIKKVGESPRRLFAYSPRQGLRTPVREDIKGVLAKGSIVAVFTPDVLTDDVSYVSDIEQWAEGITSLELLSPIAMRGNDRGSPSGIGKRGQRLAGFLAALDPAKKARVVDRLRRFYPIEELSTTKKKAGWIDLRISEAFGIGAIPAQHVSDGFLRLLALCSVPEFGNACSVVLLDEIEDGIEPHVLPRVIERIVEDSSAQFIMTSHSPLLINFFDPSSIILVSRSDEGRSRFTPLLSMEEVRRGLEYQGPGEIWANSGLATLESQAREANNTPDGEAPDRFADEWAQAQLEAL